MELLTTVGVASGGAKSAFIRSQDLLDQVGGRRPMVSLVSPGTLEGTETTFKWYASLTGESGSEFPIYDEDGEATTGNVSTSRGFEINNERFYRWPYVMFELTDGSSPVNQSAARTFQVVAVDI